MCDSFHELDNSDNVSLPKLIKERQLPPPTKHQNLPSSIKLTVPLVKNPYHEIDFSLQNLAFTDHK